MISASPLPPTDKLERLRFELHSALDWDSLWHACVDILDHSLSYHSCSLLAGIENFRAAESRHHVVAGDYFNFDSASLVSVSGPFLQAHPNIGLYTYTDVIAKDPEAPLRRIQKEVTLSAWDQFIHLVFWHRGAPDALFSVRRTAAQGDFSRPERDFLRQLHSDLGAALRRMRRLQGERSRQIVVRQFVAKLPLSVLFLDEHCKLNFATEEAFRHCALWNHGPEQARALRPRSCFRLPAELSYACHQLIESRRNGAPRPDALRVSHPDIAGLSATIDLRTPPKGPSSCFTYVVTFSHRDAADDSRRQFPADALRLLNFLTPSERQVARLVAAGRRNHEVARKLGKSLRTVEFQLSAIYRKLGIGSRTQLVRLLA